MYIDCTIPNTIEEIKNPVSLRVYFEEELWADKGDIKLNNSYLLKNYKKAIDTSWTEKGLVDEKDKSYIRSKENVQIK